jgi:outer membrane lipoprotein-sorting protein
MLRRFCSLALVALVAVLPAGSGCTREAPPPPDAPANAVVTQALDVLGKRIASVRDYSVEGVVEDAATKQQLRFRYAMQQPSFSSGELFDAAGARARAFVFDGKVLAIIDDATKTVTRQDLSQNEEQMLLALHEIFAQFVCEGWRPPLVKPQGTLGAIDGEQWVLTIPIVDEVLNSQRLVLRPDGSFVKKELLDDRGVAAASTTVLEDWKDPGTGLLFPKRWTHVERGSTQTVTLSAHVVNGGVDGARFSTATPAGYADRAP